MTQFIIANTIIPYKLIYYVICKATLRLMRITSYQLNIILYIINTTIYMIKMGASHEKCQCLATDDELLVVIEMSTTTITNLLAYIFPFGKRNLANP